MQNDNSELVPEPLLPLDDQKLYKRTAWLGTLRLRIIRGDSKSLQRFAWTLLLPVKSILSPSTSGWLPDLRRLSLFVGAAWLSLVTATLLAGVAVLVVTNVSPVLAAASAYFAAFTVLIFTYAVTRPTKSFLCGRLPAPVDDERLLKDVAEMTAWMRLAAPDASAAQDLLN